MAENPEPVAQETAEQRLFRLRRLVQLAPHDPELRYLLARQLVQSCLLDEAIDLIRSVIAMSPNHLEARKLLEQALRIQLAPRP
jgi:cytochrome c-type biogenesis protein CcmH/NrfG